MSIHAAATALPVPIVHQTMQFYHARYAERTAGKWQGQCVGDTLAWPVVYSKDLHDCACTYRCTNAGCSPSCCHCCVQVLLQMVNQVMHSVVPPEASACMLRGGTSSRAQHLNNNCFDRVRVPP